jgi:2-keto-4-pentenoate hydratase/2-oxohepta-3-ene-1,7-dioic acid hydratase in catechol pathway
VKLASFIRDGRPSYGVVVEGGVVDAAGRLPASTLKDALADCGPALRALADHAADCGLAAITWLPPIPDPQKIICVGVNYHAHLKETGIAAPKHPLLFSRFANSQVGNEQPLVRPSLSETFDYEGELAVVIGRRARHVKAADALGVVAGYACYNEGTIREWQSHTTQVTPGKNFPASGSFGPWIVTSDEITDPRKLTLVTRLNGDVVQRGEISDLVYDIPALIEYCSAFAELLPGDVICTGTTAGVGCYRKPPLWMKPGDVVEIEISGIGVLRNPVIAE